MLAISEGFFDAAFYDMYRIEDSKMAERWDALEAIPPKEQWKNSNGKL